MTPRRIAAVIAVAAGCTACTPEQSTEWLGWFRHDKDGAGAWLASPEGQASLTDPTIDVPAPPPPPQPALRNRQGDRVWNYIARCESGGRWDYPPVTNTQRHLLGWADDRAPLVAQTRRAAVRARGPTSRPGPNRSTSPRRSSTPKASTVAGSAGRDRSTCRVGHARTRWSTPRACPSMFGPHSLGSPEQGRPTRAHAACEPGSPRLFSGPLHTSSDADGRGDHGLGPLKRDGSNRLTPHRWTSPRPLDVTPPAAISGQAATPHVLRMRRERASSLRRGDQGRLVGRSVRPQGGRP